MTIEQPIESRVYQGVEDLHRMMAMQSLIKQRNPTTGLHPGDLNWWMFYIHALRNPADIWRFWETPAGQLIGWAIFVVDEAEADVRIHPDYQDQPIADEIYAWSERFFTEQVLAYEPKEEGDEPHEEITFYVDADELRRISWLTRNGFEGAADLICFTQDLRGVTLPEPVIPEGYYFLPQMTPEYAETRATAHFSAFSPRSKMTPERYLHFMTAPLYDPRFDTVLMTPEGECAAYAMGWMDAASKVSVFEPVGTRQEFQRRGLGRATQLEALRRLQAAGVEIATVNTGADDADNIAFYQSAGFKIANLVLEFTKKIR